jgi:hypothetical protein
MTLNKVKLLTILGKPTGIITNEYWAVPGGGSLCPGQRRLYWVRLKDGVLLKDVTDDELEIIKKT